MRFQIARRLAGGAGLQAEEELLRTETQRKSCNGWNEKFAQVIPLSQYASGREGLSQQGAKRVIENNYVSGITSRDNNETQRIDDAGIPRHLPCARFSTGDSECL